jgi:NarL family two-component system response regulator LiaR
VLGMTSPVRVLVADADPLARRALVERLQTEGDLELVAIATDAAASVAAVEQHKVDVVLLDAGLGPEGGLAAMRRIHAVEPRAAVLVLSTTGDHDLGLRALHAHAAGFLCKDLSLEALGRIVRCLARGEVVISRALVTKLVAQLSGSPEPGDGLRPVRSPLSTREWEVLDLICGGVSTQGMADELTVSAATIRSHVKRILRKLGVHSRAEAAAQARVMLGRS